MTKEQLMQKWGDLSKPLKNDIDAVIATEIAKSKEPQPAHNPIEQAYERGGKIRRKDWQTNCWIKKHSRVHSIDERDEVYKNYSIDFDFDDNPQNWEIYIEPQPEPTEQPAKPFDKDRFEAMFRAVVESGENTDIDYSIKVAENALKQLDAYYASKNN